MTQIEQTNPTGGKELLWASLEEKGKKTGVAKNTRQQQPVHGWASSAMYLTGAR